jgi:AcrR family transcriptional regulator
MFWCSFAHHAISTLPYALRIEAAGSSDTRSRRGRPRSLTEEQIIGAAVRLARTARLENVTMRALADELGVPVMTIYNYVANKDALHEQVVNHVLSAVRVPDQNEGTWEERLKQLERNARNARDAMGELPGLSSL